MKLVISFTCLLLSLNGFSQSGCFRVNNLYVLPGNPTDQDSVTINLDTWTCRIGMVLDNEFYLKNDTLFIKECFFIGLADKELTYRTNYKFGLLDTGTYVVHYAALLTDSFAYCLPYDTVYYQTYFQVRKFSSSNTIMSNPKVLIYPNPSHTGKFTLELKEPVEKLEIRNLTGKLIRELQGPLEVNQEINLENTPPGLYFLEITEKDKPPYLVKLLKQ